MAKKVLSIEIGTQQTRICEMDYSKNNPHVYRAISFDTPEGAVEDGFISDTSRMATALRDALTKERITTRDVIFTIASTKIANREVTIPMVKDNKIMQVVQASASDYFPVDISDYVLSYTVQQRINTKTEKQLVLLLLAAPNNLIRSYYHLARDMRMNIIAIDYNGNSLFQVIRRQIRKGVNMSLQINEQTTLINIIEDDKLILQRTIPFGTVNIIDTVKEHPVFGADTDKQAMELLCREKMLNIHFNETNQPTTSGRLEGASESYNRVMQQQQGISEITESLSYLVSNFTRVMDYYNSKNSDRRIKEVILAGPGSNIRGIEELLRNETGMDMRKLSNIYGVIFAKSARILDSEQTDYLTSVGAVFQPVGFEVKDLSSGSERDGSSTGMAVLFGFSVILSVAAVAATIFLNNMAMDEQKRIETDIAALQNVEQVYAEHDRVQEVYTSVQGMYAMTESLNDQYKDLIEMLEANLPKNTVIQSMTASDETITFSVVSTDPLLSVPKLLMLLSAGDVANDNLKEPADLITNVSVTSVSKAKQEDSNKDQLTYAVTCNYRAQVTEDTAAADAAATEGGAQ